MKPVFNVCKLKQRPSLYTKPCQKWPLSNRNEKRGLGSRKRNSLIKNYTRPYHRPSNQSEPNNGLGEFPSEDPPAEQQHWRPNILAPWFPLFYTANWALFLYSDWVPLLNTTNGNRSTYFRQLMIMTDIVIVVGNVRFPVHRYIMARASPVLDIAFYYHTWTTNVITILANQALTAWEPQPNPDIFRVLAVYSYTGRISLTTASVRAVFIMSNYFMMVDLTNACINFMVDNISMETICEWASLSEYYDLHPMIEHCLLFFIEHLEEISHRPEYKSVLPAFMKRALSLDDLVQVTPGCRDIVTSMDREIAILGYVLRYLSHHVYDRATCVLVFSVVRLNEIHHCIVNYEMKCHRKLLRIREVRRLVHLGKVLFNLREGTVAQDPNRQIPLTWHRKRVSAHYRMNSARPRSFSRLPLFEISRIVIGIRKWKGLRIICMIEVVFRTMDKKIEAFNTTFGEPGEMEYRFEVGLLENEHITRCTYASVGRYLTRMEFTTNLDFIHGPFGWHTVGDLEVEEGEHRLQPGGQTRLQNVDCKVDLIRPGVHYLHTLNLTWVHYD